MDGDSDSDQLTSYLAQVYLYVQSNTKQTVERCFITVYKRPGTARRR